MHESTTRLGCKIHLSDLKLHTAEALSIPHDGGSEQAGLLTCNGFHPLPAFRSGYNDENFLCVTYSCATVRDLHTVPY